jgi:hypothetical protein
MPISPTTGFCINIFHIFLNDRDDRDRHTIIRKKNTLIHLQSRLHESWMQCFHLQGFFVAARKYWSLQGIYKEIKFTRKWQGKIHKLKEIARISVSYTIRPS